MILDILDPIEDEENETPDEGNGLLEPDDEEFEKEESDDSEL